MSGQEILCCKH